jgi:undecaprenyl diphosphate synthase
LFFKPKKNIDKNALPSHIAIVMDGNGRWAKKRGLPRTAGHIAGADTLVKIARYAYDIGVNSLTVYAFSTENWKRSEEEVSGLMQLFLDRLPELGRLMQGREVAVRFLGDLEKFSGTLRELMKKEEERTKQYENTGKFLNICVNYGGQDEILMATKKICRDVQDGKLNIDQLTKEDFEKKLYTAHTTNPDLVIRPSGEIRISNFLLWQSAYSEFYYDNILWPDFKNKDLDKAISEYQMRNRRFGG